MFAHSTRKLGLVCSSVRPVSWLVISQSFNPFPPLFEPSRLHLSGRKSLFLYCLPKTRRNSALITIYEQYLASVCPSIFFLRNINIFRGIHLFQIQLKFDPLSNFRHKISFPMGDEMENSLSTTSIQAQRNGSNWEDPSANTASNLSNQQAPLESSPSPDCNDTKTGPMVVWSPTIAKHVLNNCYPVQTAVLSFLDRTDFRNMQLAGLGLGVSKEVQRKTLIPIACNDSRKASRFGPPRVCANTTSIMDEVKPCTGRIWHQLARRGSMDIGDCRQPHHFRTGTDVHGKSHNVCLECIQSAAEIISPQEYIPRARTTICRKHTRENTPLAHHGPCQCFEILATEWRCWECRVITLMEMLNLGYRRLSRPGRLMDVCPIMGCEEVINHLVAAKDERVGELEMCWGCQMIISPSTGNVKW